MMPRHLMENQDVLSNRFLFKNLLSIIVYLGSLITISFSQDVMPLGALALFLFVTLPTLGHLLSSIPQDFLKLMRVKHILPRSTSNSQAEEQEPFSKKNQEISENTFIISILNYGTNTLWGITFIILLAFVLSFFLRLDDRMFVGTLVTLGIFALLVQAIIIYLLLSMNPMTRRFSTSQLMKLELMRIVKISLKCAIRKKDLHVIAMLTGIILFLLIPRAITFLANPFGVIGRDTWNASALAGQIVFLGKITFLSGILGIFELTPTDETVVAPLLLAIGSIITKQSVLRIQFLIVYWITLIGFFFTIGLFNDLNVANQRQEKPNTKLNEERGRFSLLISITGAALYFTIPVVVSYTDGFFTGRTIFLMLHPILLHWLWKWMKKEQDNRAFFTKFFIVGFLLILSHRMAYLIVLPLLFLSVILLIIQRMQKLTYFSSIWARNRKIILTSSVILPTVILMTKIILDMYLSLQDPIATREKISHLTMMIPTIVTKDISRILGPYSFIFLLISSFVFILGAASFLYMAELVSSPFIIHGRFEQARILPNDMFFVITKIALIPSLILFYEAPYFYQAAILLFTVHVFMTANMIISRRTTMTNAADAHQSNMNQNEASRKSIPNIIDKFLDGNKIISFPKKQRIIIFGILLALMLQSFLTEAYRIQHSISQPDAFSSSLSIELLELSQKLQELQEMYQNASIIVPGSIGTKLASLNPSYRFFPNSRYLYAAYEVVKIKLEFSLKAPKSLDPKSLYSFLRYPYEVNLTPLMLFNEQILFILDNEITNTTVTQVLKSLRVRLVIAYTDKILDDKNHQVSLEEKPFFKSIKEILTPIYVNAFYELYELDSVLS